MKHLPETSAYWRAREPEKARWGVSEYLLAAIADSLRWLVWAKTKDAKRNRNRPKPVPRPGAGKPKKDNGKFKDVISRPIEEVKRLLSLPRK